MPRASVTTWPLHRTLRALIAYRWLALGTTVSFALLAALVGAAQPQVFEAAVQVWVRDQSGGLTRNADYAAERAARLRTHFVNLREVIYSREVLEQTLLKVNGVTAAPASPQDAEYRVDEPALTDLRRAVRIESPKGTDFGDSEMFYLRVRNADGQRALRLVTALFDQIRQRFLQLGLEQADDLVAKTTEQVTVSKRQLSDAEQQLDALVKQVGANLPDLVAMGGAPSIESELRRSINRVRELLTPALAELEQRRALLRGVAVVDLESDSFAIPASFLREQTALEQTRQAVLQAQLELQAGSAEMTADNPAWQVQRDKLVNVQNEFRREWSRARTALEREVESLQAKADYLSREQTTQMDRLTELTGRFVEYDALQSAVKQRQGSLAEAERRRSEALHTRATSAQDVLLSIVDKPRVSPNPVNVSYTRVVAIGTVLGLLTGIGLALVAPELPVADASCDSRGTSTNSTTLIALPRVRVPFQRTN